MNFQRFKDGVACEIGNATPQTFKKEDLILSLQTAFDKGVHLSKSTDKIESLKQLHYLKTIADLIPASLFAKDKEGTYRYVNSCFMGMAGIKDTDEVLGKRPSELFKTEAAILSEKEDQEILSGHKDSINQENSNVTSGNELIWGQVSKTPIKNETGEIVGLVGMVLDISERKKSEKQIALVNAEIEQKNKNLEKDLTLARSIQNALLPQQDRLPKFDTLDIAFIISHTEKLGGDFVHIEKSTPFKGSFLICDVAGSGIQSALVTSLLQGLVRELSKRGLEPSDFLGELNTRFYRTLEFHEELVFTTALYLEWEKGGRCKYARAGHPAPLFFSRHQNRAEELARTSTKDNVALGILPDTSYDSFEFILDKGDCAILYSDGIVELQNEDGQDYGAKGIRTSLVGPQNLNAQEMVEHIHTEALVYSHGAPQDDITLLVLKQ